MRGCRDGSRDEDAGSPRVQVAGLARELAGHGGDPEAAGVATRDLSPALPRGVPGRPPDAERDDGRSRVTRLATRQPGGAGSAEAGESREKRAPLARAKRAWPGGDEPRGGQAERRRTPSGERPGTARARATGGAAGGLRLRGRGRTPCAAGSRARTSPRRGRSLGPCGSTGPRSQTTPATGPPTPSPGERARQSSRPRGRHEGSATWSTSRPSSTQD